MAATTTTMYQIKLTHWDGIPASEPCTPSPADVYPFLDRAYVAIGFVRGQAPDSTNDRDLLRRIVAAIKPDHRGVKPRCAIVESR